MSKINVNISVINDEAKQNYNTNAIINDEIIKYKSQDNTTEIYNYKTNTLIRENNELRMEYNFELNNVTKGTIFIKELNNNMNLKIETKKLIRKNNDIYIEFIIENNKIIYQIEEVK